MSKINVRAPFHVYTYNEYMSYAEVELRIYTGDISNEPSLANQVLRSTAINNEVTIDISQVLRSYIDDVFSGDYSINPPWCNVLLIVYDSDGIEIAGSNTTYSVFEGFPYFELGTNAQLNDVVMMSNNTIIANDYYPIEVPVYVKDYDVTVDYYSKGILEYTSTKTFVDNSDQVVQYTSNSVGDIDMFVSRVTLDGGVVEAKECVKDAYDDYYSSMDVDYIVVSYNGIEEIIPVKEVEECKYSTYKVTFKNLYGVWQDLWFFKRSDLSITTKSEEYNSQVLSGGQYSTNRHQYKTFIKNGREKLSLNSGYYPEDYNSVFRELQLSEQAYVTYDGQVLPVNIKDGQFAYKTKLNEKLISYSIELDFAFDKINNIR